MPSSGSVVRFDRFELDLSSGDLRRDGAPLKLQPQPAKILAVLVSRPGQVVSRAEIVAQVWGSQTFVDFEQGLNFAIRQVRSVLADDADRPRFIETVPKRGYRFIAPVEPAQAPLATAAEPTAAAIPQARHRTRLAFIGGLVLVAATAAFWPAKRVPAHETGQVMLAVLPFQNLTGEPGQEFLSDGLTEEMITQLSEIGHERLGVIARTSAMAYKNTAKPVSQIGKELGADYVLEGSVRRWGEHVRVTAQLIQARSQTHVWAENYESDRADVLRLQSEMAQVIAQQIDLQLLPLDSGAGATQRRAVDPQAHDLYLQGKFHLNRRSRDDLLQSVECFKQAIARDPNYAAAYAGLADAYNLIGFYGFDPRLDAVAKAKIAADRALQLDDSMAAAHAAQAYTRFMWQEDWAGAEKEFRRALQLDDNYVPAHQWYALYLAAAGHVDEAVRQMEYAKKLDPLSPSALASLAYAYYLARDNARAIAYAQTALQLNSDSMVAHAVLGWAYTERKQYSQAIAELQLASQLSGQVPVYVCSLARAYALSGNTGEAKKIVRELRSKWKQPRGSGSALAAAYLSLGQVDEALGWLEQTAPGDIQANWLRVDPAFDAVRQNPRFVAVLSKIGNNRAQ